MAESKRLVWVPDAKDLFTKAIILEENGAVMKVRVEATGETKEISAAQAEKVNPAQFNQVGDMAELTYLNEPSVVNNLSSRWLSGKMYTYSGLFLVAVNPYRPLPIYGPEVISQFKNKRRDEADPHVYAVAEQAFRSMLDTRRDQSILITGESGAGKTENTKKAIQYLSSVTNSKTSGGVDERILQTNPILEAFGNAQTIRNANSSRFGKFIKIQFGQESKRITGASIQWYLLEKSRVVTQHTNERNYHVFYQLLSGAPADLKSKLCLPKDASPEMFSYLESGVSKIEGVDDAQLYSRLVEAFLIMGFSMANVEEIMKAVASVLLLGQIKYRASSADQGSVVNMKDVENVAGLLGVDPELFVQSITKPRVKVGKEFTTQSRTASQAQHTTNAIAKALYERLFGYIVEQLNARLGKEQTAGQYIGVLDIAGFEIFETNSFEQLCINYTNEKLQQFFNHHMFVLEQEEYVKENVDWDYVDYGSDLQPTIDLIEQNKNPMGIFSCLNEESVLPSGSDLSFNEKLIKQWNNQNKKFAPSRLGQGFKIDHYAQTVEYDTEGWIEKNKDPLSDVVEALLSDSNNKLIRSLFVSNESSKLKGKASLFRTVAQRHKEQLGDLMMHLEATQPHFVRCILPNTIRSPTVFDNKLVLDQLRYNGVLEGIRIARSGFPNRLEFSEFSQRYKALAGHISGPLDSQQTSATILQRIGLDTTQYKVGLSKIFFRNGVLADLEHRLDKLVADQTLAVQSLGRGAIVRMEMKRELHRRRAAKMIAKCFKISNRFSNDPWWQFNAGLKPLLMSKEGMDNSKKDLRMQKLESTLHKLKEEQVELISSKNELRGELISALRSKEELTKALENASKDMKDREEAHELAVTAARSRDEASSAALLELSKKHNSLREEMEQLRNTKNESENLLKDSFQEKLNSMASELEKHKTAQKEAENERNALELKLKDLESSHETSISELKSKFDQCELELKNLTPELDRVRQQLKQKEEEQANIEKELKADSNAKDDKIRDLESQLAAASEATNTLNSDHTAEVELLKSQLAEANSKMTEMEISHRNEIADLEAAKSKSSDSSEKLEKATAELSKLREWLSKAKVELKTAASTNRELAELQEKHKMLTETSSSDRQRFQTDLKISKEKVASLENQLANRVESERMETVLAEKKKITQDLDTATENLLKTSDELDRFREKAEGLEATLLKNNEELKRAKDSFNLSDKTILELQNAVTKAESTAKANDVELVTLRKELQSAQRTSDEKTKALAASIQKTKETETALSEARVKLSELSKKVAALESEAAANTRKLSSVTDELSTTKHEILKLRTQTVAPPDAPTASFQKRFGNENIELELADQKHKLAESEAQAQELERSLESLRKENAKLIVLQQKYEKLQREKAKLAQDRSQLMLGAQANRGQSRELEIARARAAEVKRLQSELNVLRLKLVRSERDRKMLEDKLGAIGETGTHNDSTGSAKSIQHRLRLLEIEKLQLSKAVHELSEGKDSRKALDTSEKEIMELGIPSEESETDFKAENLGSRLMNITGNRRVSHETLLAAEHTKTADLEEAVDVYKRRANEFHSKLEKAELVVESALRAEQAAKKQVEEYKSILTRTKEDHQSEIDDFHREMHKTKRQLEARDAEIEDLAMRANFSTDLQNQVKSLNSTLKELSQERDRLAKDKTRLENRLHDMVSSYEHQPRQLQDQLVSMKQNEQQMIREHGELRWKLERKARHVDQLRRSLADADARIEHCRSEIDRLQANDSAREIELRRANREISEANEKYLMAERELEQFRLSSRRSVHRPVDNRPAFV